MSEWTYHSEAELLFDGSCSNNLFSHENTYGNRCMYCNINDLSISEFINHHLQHIRLPEIKLRRLPGTLSGFDEKSVDKKPSDALKRSPIRLVIRKVNSGDSIDSTFSVKNTFQVLNNIKSNFGVTLNSEMSSEVSAPVSDSTQPPLALSPTPSEILRPEGFMPRSPCPTTTDDDNAEEKEETAVQSESPTSEMEHDEEDEEDNEEGDENESNEKPLKKSNDDDDENDVEDDDNDNVDNADANETKNTDCKSEDSGQQDPDSDGESERDGFSGFDSKEPVKEPTPPPPPKVGSLTILAPSSLNSSVMNGTLSISPSNSLTESVTEINSNATDSFSVLGGLSIEPVTVPNSDSVTLTPAHNGGSSEQGGNLLQGMDSGSSGDPLNLLQGFIDHPSGEYMPLDRLATGSTTCEVCGEHAPDPVSMENHRTSAGHFKCHISTDCATVIFCTKSELTSHQLNTHGIQPNAPTPAPMEQLAQQVQRLPVPYQNSSPQHASPSSSPSLQQAQMYRVPPSQSPQPGQPPQPGSIQPRAFANMNQARLPIGPGSSPNQRSSPVPDGSSLNQQRLAGKRPSPSLRPGSPGARQPGPTNGKQRRMDILLPDRHDDADCHVIAMQKRNDSGLQIQNVQGGGRDANGFQLSDSISLTTTGGRPTPNSQIGGPKKGNDANAVANILATRGITVTPAGGNRLPQPQQQPPQPQIASGRSGLPAPVTTLNLNSAISIIPTNQGRQNVQPGFAVPQGRIRNQPQQLVERPPRPPTVDLTQDTPTTHRGRPPGRLNRHTCQVCDKVFATSDALATHMVSHRSPGKLPYRCNLCNAQYPTQQGLTQHKQTFHKENAGSEMALPVVDLKQPGLVNRLASLGIRHFVPLSQLQSQTGGVFGLPIVAIDNARNPAVCNLGAVGASNVLSLGPMKAVGPR